MKKSQDFQTKVLEKKYSGIFFSLFPPSLDLIQFVLYLSYLIFGILQNCA